ncbi:MAG: hypothetical protein IPP38_12440 [Bacteroidetes bacterium]|nr:hypothetical protein [Bacteroidota bacterium]
MIEAINTGDFQIEFEKSGYIFHWAGSTKPIDNYKGNMIYEIGNKEIAELLEIRDTEIEEPSDSTPLNTTSGTEVSPTLTPSKKDDKDKKPTGQPTNEKQKAESATTPNIISEQPSQETSKPCIVLGKNVDNGKDVVFDPTTMIPKKLANQHLLIVGKSGAGNRKLPVVCFMN